MELYFLFFGFSRALGGFGGVYGALWDSTRVFMGFLE